jgi:hypothetical protein
MVVLSLSGDGLAMADFQGRTPKRAASNDDKRLGHDAKTNIGRRGGQKRSIYENSVMRSRGNTRCCLSATRKHVLSAPFSIARNPFFFEKITCIECAEILGKAVVSASAQPW